MLAFYMTPPVYDGIKRGFILAAPTIPMVIQGRIAIDQAVRILEGKDLRQARRARRSSSIDRANVNNVPQTNHLAAGRLQADFKVD